MAVSFTAVLIIAIAGALNWLLLAGYFMAASQLPRVTFIIGHYAISVVATAIVFGLLYRFLPHLSPFWTMIVAMTSMFLVEIIVFNFLYQGDLWFLTFTDWIVPVFLIASTIYLSGVLWG